LKLGKSRFTLYKSKADNLSTDIIKIDILHQGSITKENEDIVCSDEKNRKSYRLKVVSREKILNLSMDYIPKVALIGYQELINMESKLECIMMSILYSRQSGGILYIEYQGNGRCIKVYKL